VIHLFRAGVPHEIYRLMVREYFELHRILERLVEGRLPAGDDGERREGERQPNFQQELAPLRRDPQVTELLLALAVFYRHIIAQFEGAGRVMKHMNKYDIQVVRLGASTLDTEAARQMEMAVRQFYQLLAEFEVPLEIIREHDIKRFAWLLATYMRAQE
jgi:hypothetical protein